jgi:cytochrome c oxidase subunit IV
MSNENSSPHGAEAPHHKHLSGGAYVLLWLALVGLTLTSFGATFLHVGDFEMVIALAIACAKTTIVLLFFMHLIEQKFANQMVMIMSFLLVLVLVLITTADVVSRHTFPMAPQPPTTEEGN